MRKINIILLSCGMILLLRIGYSFATDDIKDETFSRIVLGNLLENPLISRINHLLEEAESSLEKNTLEDLEKLLKGYIEKKQEPKFLYYYFLARGYISFANWYEWKKQENKTKEFLELALMMSKKAEKHNKSFSDTYRVLSDLYGRLIPLKNPMIYGMLYGPRATKSADKAIKLNPKNPEAHLSQGRGYFYTPVPFGGSKKKALECYKKATEVCPNYHMNYMWIGKWYLENGEIDKAKEAFQKVLILKPNFGWAIYELEKM